MRETDGETDKTPTIDMDGKKGFGRKMLKRVGNTASGWGGGRGCGFYMTHKLGGDMKYP